MKGSLNSSASALGAPLLSEAENTKETLDVDDALPGDMEHRHSAELFALVEQKQLSPPPNGKFVENPHYSAESDDDDDQDPNIFGEVDEESEFRTS